MKKNRNIRFLTSEGIKNVSTNRLMSLASVAVLTSCLVLIGFAVLLFLNTDSLLKNIEAEILVGLDENEQAEFHRMLQQLLRILPQLCHNHHQLIYSF